MKFTNFKTWLNENVKDGVIVLLPGGFKPMHIGHVDLVRRYAEHPDVKEVKVLIGPGVRNGITQKESLEVAQLLLDKFDNVSVEAVKYPSPILTAYKYMETAEPGTYAMAGVQKGNDYARVLKFVKDYETGGKYQHTLPAGVNVVELGVNTEPIYYKGRTDENDGEPISASTLRRDILNDDYNNFRTNYPGYDEDTIKAIWDTTQIVITETDESEYDDVINESKKDDGLCQCDKNHCFWDYMYQGHGKAESCEKECWMEKDKKYNWREYYAKIHPEEYKEFCDDIASGAKHYPAFKGKNKKGFIFIDKNESLQENIFSHKPKEKSLSRKIFEIEQLCWNVRDDKPFYPIIDYIKNIYDFTALTSKNILKWLNSGTTMHSELDDQKKYWEELNDLYDFLINNWNELPEHPYIKSVKDLNNFH